MSSLVTNPHRFALTRKTLLFLLLVSCLSGCNLPQATPRATPVKDPEPTRLLPTPVEIKATATHEATSTPTPFPTSLPTPAPTATLPPPVSIETVTVPSRFMNGMKRSAAVYLPGNYRQDLNRRYKVLYAFDGQELPLIAFEVYLNSLVASKQMEPIIVVGITALDGDLRHEELGTGQILNVFGWGTLADGFNKFLIYELMPTINKEYRTLTDAKNTGVMGWSLGGLAAVYLGWQYPTNFGIVGAFSPSLWWRAESKPGYELQARVIHQLVRNGAKRPGLRMWFEAGTNEDPQTDIDKNGVVDVIQDIQDLTDLLKQKGYQPGTDFTYVQVTGGQHEITTWAKVLPEFLHWAYPAAVE
jgi:iron(III)-enterobactin esterase